MACGSAGPVGLEFMGVEGNDDSLLRDEILLPTAEAST